METARGRGADAQSQWLCPRNQALVLLWQSSFAGTLAICSSVALQEEAAGGTGLGRG